MINLIYYKEGSMRLTVPSFPLAFTHLLLALALVSVSGCGIKPGKVSPPPGVSKDTFPRTYPDPSTDPKPVQPPQAESPQQQ